jgi:two-component system, OmpR family, KDP operon response regulator KdpE
MNRGPRVLVIDADAAVRLLLRRRLAEAGYRVEARETSSAALLGIGEAAFDLVMIAIDPPSPPGESLIALIRRHSPIPIIALTGAADEAMLVKAFTDEADDVVPKPFGIAELLARTRNALRRRAREHGNPAQVVTGELKIDLLGRRVWAHDRELHLSIKPYEVLRVLAQASGRTLAHRDIILAVWGHHQTQAIKHLRQTIVQLRRLIEPDAAHPRYILTETGIGYRLALDDSIRPDDLAAL